MTHPVFFSFHVERDFTRAAEVQKACLPCGSSRTAYLAEMAEWKHIQQTEVKRIQDWIERHLADAGVTVILIGRETAAHPWVHYAIKRSHESRKGLIGIYIHRIVDHEGSSDQKGENPFDHWKIIENGQTTVFRQLYPTYDWVQDDGPLNVRNWILRARHPDGMIDV